MCPVVYRLALAEHHLQELLGGQVVGQPRLGDLIGDGAQSLLDLVPWQLTGLHHLQQRDGERSSRYISNILSRTGHRTRKC